MPQIYLSLIFHNHQPIGNFGWVFQEAYETAYLPMVECLERHPDVRVTLHYTGPLRDWLIENQPEFLPRVAVLVKREQVEVMSGAYYEPVLASLSDADKLGQIQKQTDSIKADFEYEASGLWLAERVWEPHLAWSLAQAGIKYTLVDDAHFKAIGYDDDDLMGYYVTEEQGSTLKIFATSMPLRYAIPWSPVEEVISWLHEQSQMDSPRYFGRVKIAVMGDDGEKFGMWPGTYEHVWANGWMDRLFNAIEDNAEWLGTVTPGNYATENLSLGRIYLPTSSYTEMGEWVLPPDEAWELPYLRGKLQVEGRQNVIRYLRGGLWRQFMVKYAEVNQLHKKATWVSQKVHAMRASKKKQQALDHLWAGQCNCGYWHGVFGGIYLFHIRQADYDQLLAAENLADGVESGNSEPFIKIDQTDFDFDAIDDVVVTTDRQNLVIDIDQGGGLVEWDYRPARLNLINVMTRYREGYHRTLLEAAESGRLVTPEMEITGDPEQVVWVRELDLHTKLLYDWHRRASFLDHFLHESVTLDKYYRSQYREQGNFVNQPYQLQIIEDATDVVEFSLWREGQVWQGATSLSVAVEKRFKIQAGSDLLSVYYRVTNSDGGKLNTRFGVEVNIGLPGGNDEHTYFRGGFGRHHLDEIAESDEIDDLSIISELWSVNLDLEFDQSATLWRFPLETVSASEAGYERNYQGTTMLVWWPLKLSPGRSWTVNFNVELKQL